MRTRTSIARPPTAPEPPATPAPPARCDARQRRTIIAAAHALGVPRNYARRRGLRQVREPARLDPVGLDIHGRMQWLVPEAARALAAMRIRAVEAGIVLKVVSAYRSADYQLEILRRKLVVGQSIERILAVSAAPGYSEHHSGRAVDLTTPGTHPLEEEFERSLAYAWLRRNARRFGFWLSYPRGNVHELAFEPWHWCWHRDNQRT